MNEIEYKIKHLEMIQTIINRLSNISVTVKSCSITLMAAYLALATSKSEFKNIVVPIFMGGDVLDHRFSVSIQRKTIQKVL